MTSVFADDSLTARKLQECQQANQQLSSKLALIQEQYDDALAMTKDMEQLHSRNEQLARDLRASNADRDDLRRRYDIIVALNEEYKSKPELTNQPLNEALVAQAVEKEKQQSNDRLNYLQQQLDTQKLISAKSESEASNLQSTLSAILIAAQTYFHHSFESPDKLREYLVQTVPENRSAPPSSPKIHNQNADSQLKAMLKEERKLRRIAESNLSDLETYYNNQRVQSDTMISDIEHRISDITKESELQRIRHEQEILAKDMELEAAQNTIQKLKEAKQTVPPSPQPVTKSIPNPVTDKQEINETKLNNAQLAIDTLRRQNTDLVTQLAASEAGRASDRRKMENAQHTTINTQHELDDLHAEYLKLRVQNDELEDRVSSYEQQLDAAHLSFKQTKTAFAVSNGKAEKITQALALLEKSKIEQNDEIAKLMDEREKFIGLLDRQTKVLRSLEETATNLDTQNKQLKQDLLDTESRFVEFQKTGAKEKIPATSWMCKEFPRELNTMIGSFAQNEGLPINAKLKMVLEAIGRYYNGQITAQTTENEAQSTKTNAEIDSVDGAIAAIGSLLGNDTLTFGAVAANPKSLVQAVNTLREGKNVASEKAVRLETILSDLLTKLQLPNINSLSDHVDEYHELVDALSAQRAQIAKQKKSIRLLKATLEQQASESSVRENSLRIQLKQLEDIKDKADSELAAAQLEINKLMNDAREQQRSHHANLDQRDADNDEMVAKLTCNQENERQELINALETAQSELAKLNKQCDQLDSQVKSYEEHLTHEQADKASLLKRLDDAEESADTLRKHFAEQMNTEREKMKRKMDKLIEDHRFKGCEQTGLVEKLSGALGESEERAAKLAEETTQMEMELGNEKARRRALEEDVERERKMLNTRMRMMGLKAETRIASAADEARDAVERREAELFSTVARAFRQYFNAKVKLDSREFDRIVQTASADLSQLEKQVDGVRRLLGITMSESPEEALTQLLYSFYRCK